MTAQDILAMDGPALTRVAWELRLAPEGIALWFDMPYNFAARLLWEPHLDVDQANQVFRQLRARGWYCETSWSPRGATTQVNVWHPPSVLQSHIVCRYGQEGQDSEALALLRCACLAVASQQQESPAP